MMRSKLPEKYVDLLDGPVVVMLATVMADGQPQVTPVWCDRHDNQVWVNTAAGRQKERVGAHARIAERNMRQRPRVTIAATDPDNPYRWLEVRGRIVETVEGQPAVDHIHKLSNDYFGRPFTFNDPDEQRVIFKIEPTHVNASG